ncbi:MAG: hypothetical protein EBT79_13880, partial [Actinobacteria bacterium]|nr:hypothetical protein [Actinomycetota bacterium]
VKVPSSEVFVRIDKARGILNDMGSLASRRKAALTEISTAKAALLTTQGNLTTLQGEVTTMLGDRGECPTCHTFCDTPHLSEQAG